jgi:hypothetical protein
MNTEETSFQQRLMNEVYDHWNEDPQNRKRLSSCDHFGPVHRAAVQFGNLNCQVENGGFFQWWDNGYGPEDIDDLIKLTRTGKAQGIKYFDKLLSLLRGVKQGAPCNTGGSSRSFYEQDLEAVDEFYDYCESKNFDNDYYKMDDILVSYEEFLTRLDEKIKN